LRSLQRRHSHGGDGFGIAPAGLQQCIPRNGKLCGVAGRRPGPHLGQDGEDDKNNGAGKRSQSDIRMKQKTDAEIDRQPGQIEEGRRSGARQEIAHRVEVAHRLRSVALGADFERQPDDGVIDAGAHRLIQAVADAHQDAAANGVDEALGSIEPRRQNQQRHERRHAAAWQDPVVDFQHEQRAGEHQNVAHAAKHGDRDEGLAAGA
jgi:hypothetical protein